MKDAIAVEWTDGIGGFLSIRVQREEAIRNPKELARFLYAHHEELSADLLSTLGALAFFLSIREFGRGTPGRVLQRADKALDSAYLVVSDPSHTAILDQGIEELRNHLFEIRGEAYNLIVKEAFNHVLELLPPVISPSSY